MDAIKNLNIYNSNMAMSMQDKLFFLDIVNDFDTFVDFGCADGTLMEYMSNLTKETKFVGIDMNQDMLDLAKEKINNGVFIKDTVPKYKTQLREQIALNLSSVLHEVNSYCTNADECKFWDSVNNNGYKYIIIRDMVYNDTQTRLATDEEIRKLRNFGDPKQISDFEDIWGSIKYKKNLIHFLLKYRYKENWQREVKENYLGYSTDDIIKNINQRYKLIYRKDYVLPYLGKSVYDDFTIKINTPTHTNLIFVRN